MGLKKFLVSKYGAITAGLLGTGAGVATNFGIANAMKDSLVETARNQAVQEWMDEKVIGMNFTIDEYLELARGYLEQGNANAIEFFNRVDVAESAAELSAHYQPQTIAGTAAVAGVIIGGYLIARHCAKKSLEQQEMAR